MWKAACLAIFLLLSGPAAIVAQDIYFPPVPGNGTWETLDPASLGWCPGRIDSLYNFLGSKNTKAFMVLKDGRIVLEHYFGTFTQDSLWYWASAGKTLKSTLVGIAQEEGYLDINAPASTYLGTGWTSETPTQEQQITVRHQLSMTTGLDDGVDDPDCTDPGCLHYKADAGMRWAYHNAPYTLLRDVVASATGQPFQVYFNQKIKNPIGMDGLWIPVGELQLYFSTARSMARFGLLALNGMVWGTDTILHDTAFFHDATSPSQHLNQGYGYLWWLNGQSSFMMPQTQLVFPGPLMPDAPPDMFCGLGKNNQLLNVVPSQGIVLVRLGNDPDPDPNTPSVSILLDNQIWQRMNELDCNTGITEPDGPLMQVSPNPCTGRLQVTWPTGHGTVPVLVMDTMGRTVARRLGPGMIGTEHLAPGAYVVQVSDGAHRLVSHFVKQ
ncbi:MAG TPA: serine hydrolase [Flavobacteriales bacterium]|nr:serine hydrolase [Flavobacteriales bacterium]